MQTSTETAIKSPKSRVGLYAVIAALILVIFVYIRFLDVSQGATTSDFYRVLFEASSQFNENLTTIQSVHKYGDGVTSIRSLLPNYRRKTLTDLKGSCQDNVAKGEFTYSITAQNLNVKACEFDATLTTTDILPKPVDGFSQYLFADEKGNVLATSGDEKTISLVKLSSISQEFMRQKNQTLFNLAQDTKSQQGGEQINVSLPSYSSHIDMQLSYGEFRVFIFPFNLHIPLNTEQGTESKLYLVGLLPKHQLLSRGVGHWDISIFVVTLVSVLFMWALLRLYLLPKNHSITRVFRTVTHVSSYAFFIVFMALVLAYLNKYVAQTNKDRSAHQYASELSQGLNDDLLKAFNQLDAYRLFYKKILPLFTQAEIPTAQTSSKKSALLTSESEGSIQFNKIFNQGLADIRPTKCSEPKPPSGSLPNNAVTKNKLYSFEYECNSGDNGNWTANLKLEADDIKLVKNAQKSDESNVATLDLYASNIQVDMVPGKSIETYLELDATQGSAPTLLNVFAMGSGGQSSLPSIYFQENNTFPSTFNLSHRDYFKQVRDHKGWDVTLSYSDGDGASSKTFSNVFIQRLRNISNGTRGTTISMPLYDANDLQSKALVNPHILGSDVLLPSVSLSAPPAYDFSFMIVERNTGQVLFHNDESRSLVENLFFSGNQSSNLNQWIKAGLDYSPTGLLGDHDISANIVPGYYHGEAGRYVLHPTPVDSWAIVVFYPDDPLVTLMTNKFLFICISFAFSLLAIGLIATVLRYFINTRELKHYWGLPLSFNSKEMINLCSIVLGMIYCLHSVAHLVDTNPLIFPWLPSYSPIWLPSLTLVWVFYFGYRGYKRLFKATEQDYAEYKQGLNGALLLAVLLAILASAQLVYLQSVVSVPLTNIKQYYQQVTCSHINLERQQLIKIGLSRYPNSVTQQRKHPFDLLNLGSQWREQLHGNSQDVASNVCKQQSSAVEPKDYPKLSSIVATSFMWNWVRNHIFQPVFSDTIDLPHANVPPPSANDESFAMDGKLASSILWTSLLLTLLIWAWLHFNRHVLWYRLYSSQHFLKHIKHISRTVTQLPAEQLDVRLKIEIDSVKLNGVDLSVLQRTMLAQEQDVNTLMKGFEQLYKLSPYLRELTKQDIYIPNVKIHIDLDISKNLSKVEIWDIETALEIPLYRQHLLELIMELKSLTLGRQLEGLTLFSGFYSLQKVKMKDPLGNRENGAKLAHAEYLGWSECLMDFSVMLPGSMYAELDYRLLAKEIEHFPELSFLSYLLEGHEGDITDKPCGLLKQRHWRKYTGEWATINCILLCAGAVYRYKWEACSNAEKLALYNLAKKQRLNPINSEMIEHLALNGLIRVKNRHLDIVNKSFAHFILHAETTQTLTQLIQDGEAGTWKSYRLPLGLLVILIIGGVALTSGESIYIIAASALGVMGTIASVANSANMLKGQFKE